MIMMKRMLFDSSVYGRLVEDSELIGMLLKQIPEKFVIYGSETIRRELRDTPKYVRHEGKNLRIFLLNIYSSVTREQGGARSNEKMRDDFLIIATAAIYNLDIVISDDEKTMFSESSIKAYRIVNEKSGGFAGMMPDKFFDAFSECRVFHRLGNIFCKLVCFFHVYHNLLLSKEIFKVNYGCGGSGAPSTGRNGADGRGEVRIWPR